MIIKTKLTERDFINATFVLLFKRIIIKIFFAVMLLSVLLFLVSAFVFSIISVSQIIMPLIFLFLFPVLTYFSAKRSYASNKRFNETIEYNFENEYLSIKGETFNVQASWDKIYKVTQTKNWIFIWHSRQQANTIPKKDIWEGDQDKLKELLDKHKVKNNL